MDYKVKEKSTDELFERECEINNEFVYAEGCLWLGWLNDEYGQIKAELKNRGEWHK